MADGHDHEFPARSVNGRCLSSARVAELYGDLSRTLKALASAEAGQHDEWIGELRAVD